MSLSTRRSLAALTIVFSLVYPAQSNAQPVDSNAEAPQIGGSLIALYTFDEGSGDIVHDTSDNGEPLDLTIADTASVLWLDGSLEVTGSAVITSLVAASKVIDAVRATQEVTLEAWVTPTYAPQFGPARIVALSENGYPDGANFMLGQADRYTMRFRTTRTNQYGNNPNLKGTKPLVIAPTHLIFTRNVSGATSLYVDGVLVDTGNPGASLDSWNENYRLTLANEPTGDRAWIGTLHFVAIYDFALSPMEVTQNFDASSAAGVAPRCSSDSDCDDTLFCNGSEICDGATGRCARGEAACVDAARCSEAGDVCLACLTDAECNDGLFCNGTETCDSGTGQCVRGALACGDAAHCDETGDACLDCIGDPECDDGSFCNGLEQCVAGGCTAGEIACNDTAHCDEGSGICLQCVNDAECNDNLSCTSDSCVLGVCDSASSCTSNESCDIAQDQCVPPDPRISDGLIVLYTFDEGSGEIVRDNSGTGTPLDLTIADAAAVKWLGGSLELASPAVISSSGPAEKVTQSVLSTGEVTVEAWSTASSVTQDGPARIVALSENPFPDGANFMLGQNAKSYTMRFRTTNSNQYGSEPSLDGPENIEHSLSHVVFTRDDSGQTKLYVNGILEETGNPGTSLASWDTNHILSLGNENTGDRPWLGTLHLVAIYDRDLAPAEVAQNYAAGASAEDVLACLLDADCDDGKFCTGTETCNFETGQCVAGAAACADSDHCDEAVDICLMCIADTDCDDTLSCTVDSCVANVCESSSSCDTGEICDSDINLCAPAAASVPLAPSGITASAVARNRIDVSWDADPNGVERFELVRAESQFSTGAQELGQFQPLLANIAPDGTSVTDGSVAGGTAYCYRVRAVSAVGASAFSEMACDRTPECSLDSECDDNDFCNGAETCNLDIGLCTPGSASCVDPDHCDEDADACLTCIANIECDDGDFCNGNETCNTGTHQCDAGTSSCVDAEHCDEAVDFCLGCIDDAECDDAAFCNGAEICDPASSQCRSDGASCSDAAHCDETRDICLGCTSDGECSDGTFCNGPEICDAETAVCQPGPAACSDEAHCDEAGDACLQCITDAECDDGAFCNGTEACSVETSQCVGGPAACIDAAHCDGAAGTCLACVEDAECDDGMTCTVDSCVANACENASSCGAGEACSAELDLCAAIPPTSPPLVPSGLTASAVARNQIDLSWAPDSTDVDRFELERAVVQISPIPFLNPEVLGPFELLAADIPEDVTVFRDNSVEGGTGYCYRVRAVNAMGPSAFSEMACDRTPECTLDSECNDANFCNGVETCNTVIGLCAQGAIVCEDRDHCDEDADECLGCIADAECDDGNFCNGAEICDAATAVCGPGTTTCSDEEHCNDEIDVCLGCIFDDECSDGLFCNGEEFCDPVSSQCWSGESSCIDAAHCDETADVCLGCTDDTECSDGTFCNGEEICNLDTGDCQPGPASCSDPGHCDESNDICVECISDGECDNRTFCDGIEACAAGVCVAGPSACADSNYCDEAAGCLECLSDDECDDGASCSDDTCMAGLCEHASTCGPGFECDVDLECVEVVPLLPPPAPSGVIVTAEAPDRIGVQWSYDSDIEATFELQRAQVFIFPIAFLNPYVLGPFETLVVGIGADTRSFSDATVIPETGFCYRVRAVNATAASEYSFWDCDTTPVVSASVSNLLAPARLARTASSLHESAIASERRAWRALDPYLAPRMRVGA